MQKEKYNKAKPKKDRTNNNNNDNNNRLSDGKLEKQILNNGDVLATTTTSTTVNKDNRSFQHQLSQHTSSPDKKPTITNNSQSPSRPLDVHSYSPCPDINLTSSTKANRKAQSQSSELRQQDKPTAPSPPPLNASLQVNSSNSPPPPPPRRPPSPPHNPSHAIPQQLSLSQNPDKNIPGGTLPKETHASFSSSSPSSSLPSSPSRAFPNNYNPTLHHNKSSQDVNPYISSLSILNDSNSPFVNNAALANDAANRVVGVLNNAKASALGQHWDPYSVDEILKLGEPVDNFYLSDLVYYRILYLHEDTEFSRLHAEVGLLLQQLSSLVQLREKQIGFLKAHREKVGMLQTLKASHNELVYLAMKVGSILGGGYSTVEELINGEDEDNNDKIWHRIHQLAKIQHHHEEIGQLADKSNSPDNHEDQEFDKDEEVNGGNDEDNKHHHDHDIDDSQRHDYHHPHHHVCHHQHHQDHIQNSIRSTTENHDIHTKQDLSYTNNINSALIQPPLISELSHFSDLTAQSQSENLLTNQIHTTSDNLIEQTDDHAKHDREQQSQQQQIYSQDVNTPHTDTQHNKLSALNQLSNPDLPNTNYNNDMRLAKDDVEDILEEYEVLVENRMVLKMGLEELGEPVNLTDKELGNRLISWVASELEAISSIEESCHLLSKAIGHIEVALLAGENELHRIIHQNYENTLQQNAGKTGIKRDATMLQKAKAVLTDVELRRKYDELRNHAKFCQCLDEILKNREIQLKQGVSSPINNNDNNNKNVHGPSLSSNDPFVSQMSHRGNQAQRIKRRRETDESGDYNNSWDSFESPENRSPNTSSLSSQVLSHPVSMIPPKCEPPIISNLKKENDKLRVFIEWNPVISREDEFYDDDEEDIEEEDDEDGDDEDDDDDDDDVIEEDFEELTRDNQNVESKSLPREIAELLIDENDLDQEVRSRITKYEYIVEARLGEGKGSYKSVATINTNCQLLLNIPTDDSDLIVTVLARNSQGKGDPSTASVVHVEGLKSFKTRLAAEKAAAEATARKDEDAKTAALEKALKSLPSNATLIKTKSYINDAIEELTNVHSERKIKPSSKASAALKSARNLIKDLENENEIEKKRTHFNTRLAEIKEITRFKDPSKYVFLKKDVSCAKLESVVQESEVAATAICLEWQELMNDLSHKGTPNDCLHSFCNCFLSTVGEEATNAIAPPRALVEVMELAVMKPSLFGSKYNLVKEIKAKCKTNRDKWVKAKTEVLEKKKTEQEKRHEKSQAAAAKRTEKSAPLMSSFVAATSKIPEPKISEAEKQIKTVEEVDYSEALTINEVLQPSLMEAVRAGETNTKKFYKNSLNNISKTKVKIPLDDLVLGAKYEGCVVGIAKFGFFVDIGTEKPGLVHISQIREGFIADVFDEVKMLQVVTVRIASLNLEKRNFSCSLRDLEGAMDGPIPEPYIEDNDPGESERQDENLKKSADRSVVVGREISSAYPSADAADETREKSNIERHVVDQTQKQEEVEATFATVSVTNIPEANNALNNTSFAPVFPTFSDHEQDGSGIKQSIAAVSLPDQAISVFNDKEDEDVIRTETSESDLFQITGSMCGNEAFDALSDNLASEEVVDRLLNLSTSRLFDKDFSNIMNGKTDEISKRDVCVPPQYNHFGQFNDYLEHDSFQMGFFNPFAGQTISSSGQISHVHALSQNIMDPNFSSINDPCMSVFGNNYQSSTRDNDHVNMKSNFSNFPPSDFSETEQQLYKQEPEEFRSPLDPINSYSNKGHRGAPGAPIIKNGLTGYGGSFSTEYTMFGNPNHSSQIKRGVMDQWSSLGSKTGPSQSLEDLGEFNDDILKGLLS